MRTTITIDDEAMKQLRRFEKEKNTARAIRSALEKYLHYRRVEEVMKLAGENLLRDDYDIIELRKQDAKRTEALYAKSEYSR